MRNCRVLTAEKTFEQSNLPRKQAEGLCDPLDGNNSIVEHLHNSYAKMCKLQ